MKPSTLAFTIPGLFPLVWKQTSCLLFRRIQYPITINLFSTKWALDSSENDFFFTLQTLQFHDDVATSPFNFPVNQLTDFYVKGHSQYFFWNVSKCGLYWEGQNSQLLETISFKWNLLALVRKKIWSILKCYCTENCFKLCATLYHSFKLFEGTRDREPLFYKKHKRTHEIKTHRVNYNKRKVKTKKWTEQIRQ